MITMTDEQLEKIKLLDSLFGAIGLETLKEFAESEKIVARLKGTDQNPGLLMRLVQENEIHGMYISSLQTEIMVMKEDVKNLIKVVNILVSTPQPYIQDLQVLKSKYSIY